MKISLSYKEARALKDIMESIEEGSVKDLTDSLKNNKLIKVDFDVLAGAIVVEVNEDYTAEFLEVYGKYLDVLVSQAKTMYKTVVLLTEEAEKVVVKHVIKNAEKTEENTEEKTEENTEKSSEDTKEE